jgi:hypothetical protein
VICIGWAACVVVLDVAGIGRSREQRDARERRQHLLEKFQPLAREIGKNGGQSSDVAARSRQASDHTRLDRIESRDKDDGHRVCVALRAGSTAGVPEARITSALRRIRSAARPGSCLMKTLPRVAAEMRCTCWLTISRAS